MSSKKTILVVITLLLASSVFGVTTALTGKVYAEGVEESPSAQPSPTISGSPTPEPSPSATVDPAVILDIKLYKQKALKVEKQAKKARARLVELRRAFEQRLPLRLKPRSSFDTWEQCWRYYKNRRDDFRQKNDELWKKMKATKGKNAAKWWPLARYLGWPVHEKANWIYCVLHESGGRYWVQNSIGASGLMQIYPACKNWKNPVANIKAGLKKYWANRKEGHSGWRPWVVMWSRIGW